MNRLKTKVVLIVAVLGMSLVPNFCAAAEHDFRTGTFEGNWCGMAAQFNVQRKVGNSWKFEGTILIRATGQIDRIEIVQFADNHLRIVRFLSGQHVGKHQTMSFYRPETLVKGGRRVWNFRAEHGYGIGSNNLGHLLMPAQ